MALYRRVDACRCCGSRHLSTVLDLGIPFISDFLLPGEEGIRAPMGIVRCGDCTLVQTHHTVDRDVLFRDYHYLSGTNESMVAALRDVVQDACSRVTLNAADAVLDIGANDGTLLAQYPAIDLHRWAFEPAKNVSCRNADSLVRDFWPPHEWFPSMPKAKIVTSIACFYAQDDPHAFVAAIKKCLHPEGVWVVQLQDLASVLRDRAFDYFCHEHLCLYSPLSFDALLSQHDLQILDTSRNDVNGGSIRFIVGHGRPKHGQPMMPEDHAEAWADFGTAIATLKADTVGMLTRLKALGKTVHGIAASTKGNTLLQFYGLTPELLPMISERQPQKWGRHTVGTGIPIVSEEESRAARPDFYLALAWHFAASFEQRESVPLILPLPQLEVRSKAKVAA